MATETSQDAPARAVLIWLRGLGDNGDGWSFGLSQAFRGQRQLRVAIPDLPYKSVACNMGMKMPAWFDITEIPVTESSDDDAEGMAASVATIHAAIDGFVEAGVPAERVFLGGFSQGGAVTLCAGLTYPARLAGLVVLSGWAMLRGEYPGRVHEANRETPVFWGHGEEDNVVLFSLGRSSADFLREHGLQVDFHSYPGVAHSSDDREMEDMRGFVEGLLSS